MRDTTKMGQHRPKYNRSEGLIHVSEILPGIMAELATMVVEDEVEDKPRRLAPARRHLQVVP